jgi:hypothetical protein
MKRPRHSRKRFQQGYAYLLVVFMTTLLVLGTMVAAPAVRTERQREKEEEMIWRGKQYVRAIKLYYRKNGRFPTSLDDLIKPKNGSLRYLRFQYKDPMNKEDGSWRLIYVGPSGQLIGSLKPQQGFQFGGGFGGAQVGTPAGQAGFGTSQGFGNSTGFGNSQPGSTGLSTTGTQGPGTIPGTPGTGTDANAAGNNNGPSPAPLAPSDSGPTTIIGGNIIGVGSKIDKKSIIMYEKAKNYHLFEFIWDPSKDTMAIGGQPGMQVGTPNAPGQQPGQGFGQSGFGQSGFGTQPSTNPSNNPNNNPMSQPTTPPLTPNSPQP